jgi:hypothetical protein
MQTLSRSYATSLIWVSSLPLRMSGLTTEAEATCVVEGGRFFAGEETVVSSLLLVTAGATVTAVTLADASLSPSRTAFPEEL